MKALTLPNPWHWATVAGGLDVLVRGTSTKHRGVLAVYAGATTDRHWQRLPALRAAYSAQTRSEGFNDPKARARAAVARIVGTVEVTGCHRADECPWGSPCSPWAAMPGAWHWTVAEPPLATPPVRVALPGRGLWDVPEPALAMLTGALT